MNRPIETQLLDALELFHYSHRFRHSLFVLLLTPETSIEMLISDLKLLQASHIATLLLCSGTAEVVSSLDKLSQRGLRCLGHIFSRASDINQDQSDLIRSAFQDAVIPVLLYQGKEDSPLALCQEGIAVSQLFEADKLFYLSSARGLIVEGTLQSFLPPEEVAKLLLSNQEIDFSPQLLAVLHQANKDYGLEIVILDGAPGSLFQEIFTHRGRGTLLTDDYPNVIRQARLSDVFEISRLLKPSIDSGLILPVTEDEIAESIDHYHVFTVNSAIVAAAQLADYGQACALAKFCTLPRYQGKGRARELAAHLIEAAKQRGKDYIFAVSVSGRMLAFLAKLGFNEIPREQLPESWKKGYDFSRPSRAFAYFFNSAPPPKRKKRKGK